MRQHSLVGLVTVLLSSCAVSACAPVSVADEPIVGGTRGGNAAVVWISDRSNGSLCSGSLIAPRVVLTAKHCVQNPGASAPVASSLVVGTGDIANRGRFYQAQSAYTTPGVWREDSRTGVSGALIGVDVAVIVLSSPITGVEPLPLFRTDPRPLRGRPFTAVGFGEIPRGGAGIKYNAMGTIEGVSGAIVYVGNIICQGDSGGPMILADGTVPGVVSFGNGTTCGTGSGAYNAIFPFLDMIDMAIEEGGTCVPTGAELCDGRDNNCNDLVDETCLALGSECRTDSQCTGGTCGDTVAGRLCTSVCDARNPTVGCEEGLYCAAPSGQCGGFCVPSEGGARTGINAAPCTINEDCVSLNCVDPGDGNRRCLTSCEAGAGACPAGEVCANTAGTCGSCLASALVSGMRQLGEPCTEATQCVGSVCLVDSYPGRPAQQYCSRGCSTDAECGTRFHCRDSVCIAGPRGRLGDTCSTSADCVDGNFCASQGSRRWCTLTCGTCEAGFTCTPVGGTQVCVPDAGLVGDGCSTNEECVTGLCAVGASIDGMPGTCTRACGPNRPCATGLLCQRLSDGVSSACIWPAEPPPPPAPPSSGCHVSASHGAARVPGAGALLMLALGAWVARRRRA